MPSFQRLIVLLFACVHVIAEAEHLPSWNQGSSKSAIVNFVEKVTKPGSAEYIEPEARIAVFDNDGTLWAEQPLYFQLAFALDRVKALAPQHPEWKEKEPFKSVLAGDLTKVLAGGEKGILELVLATHTGVSTEEFESIVTEWITTAKHPKSGVLYTQMVYQPMLELLNYLRAHGFKTYIVSGGGVEFIRPWAARVYGIPPEQVIGSRVKVKYEILDNKPTLIKLSEIDLVDDGPGKPVGIHQSIGRRPVIAVGNSDGDLQMLQWSSAGNGARLAVYLHHTDAVREWAYDKDSPIGKLDKGLTEAQAKGWTVIDMKTDWKVVFPPSGS